jgi:hypothetical protein
MKSKISIFLFCLILFTACTDNKPTYRGTNSESSGNINSLNVIVENDDWNGLLGEQIRRVFAANVDGLPQQEPLFNLNQIPPSAFSGFARKNRTFFKIEFQDTKPKHRILIDSFAKPQTGVIVYGKQKNEIAAYIEEHADEFIKNYKNTEVTEQLRRIRKSLKDDSPLKENLAVTMQFPTAYRYAKEESDFVWMRKDIKNGNMELTVYEVPIHRIENDRDVICNIINIRDSIGKTHIPGPSEGQYMITEEAFAPYIKEIKFRGRKAFEVKGTWEVKGAFMAGPFFTYVIKDDAKNRYLIAEGFVFRPSYSKRDQIFEIEAILKSLQFTEDQ